MGVSSTQLCGRNKKLGTCRSRNVLLGELVVAQYWLAFLFQNWFQPSHPLHFNKSKRTNLFNTVVSLYAEAHLFAVCATERDLVWGREGKEASAVLEGFMRHLSVL